MFTLGPTQVSTETVLQRDLGGIFDCDTLSVHLHSGMRGDGTKSFVFVGRVRAACVARDSRACVVKPKY